MQYINLLAGLITAVATAVTAIIAWIKYSKYKRSFDPNIIIREVNDFANLYRDFDDFTYIVIKVFIQNLSRTDNIIHKIDVFINGYETIPENPKSLPNNSIRFKPEINPPFHFFKEETVKDYDIQVRSNGIETRVICRKCKKFDHTKLTICLHAVDVSGKTYKREFSLDSSFDEVRNMLIASGSRPQVD